MIELHNCDCMDYMRDLPDKAFDLAIVDPPYGLDDWNDRGTNKRLYENKNHMNLDKIIKWD